MTSRYLPATAAVLVALVVGACAGSTATTAPTVTTAAPSQTAAATTAPTAAPAASSEAPTDASASGAAGPPDLSTIFGSVDLLDSLDKYEIGIEIVDASGTTKMDMTTVREPVVASKVDMVTAGQQISIVRIGDKAWVKQGSTAFVAVPVAMVSTLTDVLAPEKLFASFRNQDAFKYLTPVGTETKNGVQATHYHVDDKTALPAGSETIPPGAMGDVWVSEEGYLVALEFSGANTEIPGQGTIESMKIEVSHINDPALEITPPG